MIFIIRLITIVLSFLIFINRHAEASVRCSHLFSDTQNESQTAVKDINSFGKAMSEGMLLNPEQGELFEIYRQMFFGDPATSVNGNTLHSVHTILKQHPELGKPHFREYEIATVQKIYSTPETLSKYLQSLSDTSGQVRSNLFRIEENLGFWRKALGYPELSIPDFIKNPPGKNSSESERLEYKKKKVQYLADVKSDQERFVKYLNRIISKTNRDLIADLKNDKEDYFKKAKSLYMTLKYIQEWMDKKGRSTQVIRQAMIDLAHTVGFGNQATQALLKNPNGLEKVEGLKKLMDERDTLAMEVSNGLHFIDLLKQLKIEFPTGLSKNEDLPAKIVSFEKEVLGGSFKLAPAEKVRVRSLSIQEAPFRSCLGGSDCSSRTYFSKALDPNYNYFTLTDSTHKSSGHVTVVLGEARSSSGQNMKVAFVDKLQNVPNQLIPVFLKAVSLSLSEKGYKLGLPEDVGDHNGLSNMDTIRHFVANDILPKLLVKVLSFTPHPNPYKFENKYSRAYSSPDLKIFDESTIRTDLQVTPGMDYTSYKAASDLSKDQLIQDFLALKTSKELADRLKYITSTAVVQSLAKSRLMSISDFKSDIKAIIQNKSEDFSLRKVAFLEFIRLNEGNVDAIETITEFSRAEQDQICSEIENWKNSPDKKKVELSYLSELRFIPSEGRILNYKIQDIKRLFNIFENAQFNVLRNIRSYHKSEFQRDIGTLLADSHISPETREFTFTSYLSLFGTMPPDNAWSFLNFDSKKRVLMQWMKSNLVSEKHFENWSKQFSKSEFKEFVRDLKIEISKDKNSWSQYLYSISRDIIQFVGNDKFFSFAVSLGADLNSSGTGEQTLLGEALRENKIDRVEFLLKAGASPLTEFRTRVGSYDRRFTPLEYIIRNKQVESFINVLKYAKDKSLIVDEALKNLEFFGTDKEQNEMVFILAKHLKSENHQALLLDRLLDAGRGGYSNHRPFNYKAISAILDKNFDLNKKYENLFNGITPREFALKYVHSDHALFQYLTNRNLTTDFKIDKDRMRYILGLAIAKRRIEALIPIFESTEDKIDFVLRGQKYELGDYNTTNTLDEIIASKDQKLVMDVLDYHEKRSRIGHPLFDFNLENYSLTIRRAIFVGMDDVAIRLLSLNVPLKSVQTEQTVSASELMYLAILKNQRRFIRQLLKRKIDLNVGFNGDDTLYNRTQYKYDGERFPLIGAIRQGDLSVVKLLVENGALVNITPKYGDSPLLASLKKGDFEITKFLIAQGAKISEDVVLHLINDIRNERNLDIVQYLIDQKRLDINDSDFINKFFANKLKGDFSKSFEALISLGFNINNLVKIVVRKEYGYDRVKVYDGKLLDNDKLFDVNVPTLALFLLWEGSSGKGYNKDDLKSVHYLLEKNFDFNRIERNPVNGRLSTRNLLLLACELADMQSVKIILSKVSSQTIKSIGKEALEILIARKTYYDVAVKEVLNTATELVRSGAPVDAKILKSIYEFSTAANVDELVTEVIRHGVDLKQLTIEPYTPNLKKVAVYYESIQWLLSAGISPFSAMEGTSVGNRQLSLFLYLVYYGNGKLALDFILKNYKIPESEMNFAVELAISNNQVENLEKLLMAGANPNGTINSQSYLDFAVNRQRAQGIIDILGKHTLQRQ